MKWLIAGLGNIGTQYAHTRHNIGFDIADELARLHHATFVTDRYADYAAFRLKHADMHIIKPTTFMNLSGKAVRYWMDKLGIPSENVLIVVDDMAIDFGKLRIRKSGSDAGHNGLKNVQETLQTQNYPRLRFGIGRAFAKGQQVAYVLGKWNAEEQLHLPQAITNAVLAIEKIALSGIDRAMNECNTK